jgi:DNA-binding transcriptional ArsR family regulator
MPADKRAFRTSATESATGFTTPSWKEPTVATNLSRTARAVLQALTEDARTTDELAQAIGRRAPTVDKALAELSDAGLITAPDSASGDTPRRWHVSQTPVPDEPTTEEPTTGEDTTGEDTTGQDTTGQAVTGGSADSGNDQAADDTVSPEDVTAEDVTADDLTAEELPAEVTTSPSLAGQETTAVDGSSDVGGSPDQSGESGKEPGPDGAAEVKLCRGCQAQMPLICPCCWQKTTSYCAECRKKHSTSRRGDGEPVILSNGLPKLRPGQLEELVLGVMRQQPTPTHLGIIGWTSGRMAIHLPGRSSGAIGNALDKLTTTGNAVLLGEAPKRYQLAPTDPTDPADPADSDNPISSDDVTDNTVEQPATTDPVTPADQQSQQTEVRSSDS